MRISDWSSDVCSSDLLGLAVRLQRLTLGVEADRILQACLASFQPVNDFFKTPQRLFKAQRVYRCRVPIHASRSEEHTSELQSLMSNSYADFCLKKKNKIHTTHNTHTNKNITDA